MFLSVSSHNCHIKCHYWIALSYFFVQCTHFFYYILYTIHTSYKQACIISFFFLIVNRFHHICSALMHICMLHYYVHDVWVTQMLYKLSCYPCPFFEYWVHCWNILSIQNKIKFYFKKLFVFHFEMLIFVDIFSVLKFSFY